MSRTFLPQVAQTIKKLELKMVQMLRNLSLRYSILRTIEPPVNRFLPEVTLLSGVDCISKIEVYEYVDTNHLTIIYL